MPAIWTLEWNGQVKTLAEWGLKDLAISYASQAADVASFTYVGPWENARNLFGFRDRIIIRKDGRQWFVGTITSLPIMTSAQTEEMEFEAKGPWLFLEEHVYQVQWPSAGQFTSHIVYNTHTTRQEIMYVLDYLLAQHAADPPFQFASVQILPGVELFAPVHEDRDLTCAQVIQQILRWHRDVVVWFDYSQTPPLLIMRRRGQLEETVTLSMPKAGDSGPISEVALFPRVDLERPCVVINYERRNTVNGKSKLQIVEDIYPPGFTGKEYGAWCVSVDLLGFNKTTVSGSLYCEALNLNQNDWWKAHEPKLAGTNIGNLVISEVTRSGVRGFANELIEGQIAPWMELAGGTPVSWERETIKAKATFRQFSGPANDPNSIDLGQHVPMEVSVKLVSTNAPAGDSSYETVESIEAGDPQPVGLARYLFEQFQAMEWSGQIVLIEEEVSGKARIGNLVNIAGGHPDWATMAALVQSVTEEIGTGTGGTTRLRVGPPEQLGIQDLVELLKVGRRRLRWTNPAMYDSGELDAVELGKATANTDSGLGPTQQSSLVLTPDKAAVTVGGQKKYNAVLMDATSSVINIQRKDKPGKVLLSLGTAQPATLPQLIITGDADGAAPGLGSVIIDLNDLATVPAASRVVRLREVCVKVGPDTKKMMVLGTAPY